MRSRVVTGLVLGVTALVLVFAASPLVGWAASLILGFLGGLELVRLVAPREDAGLTLGIACGSALVAATLSAPLALLAALAGAMLLVLESGRSWRSLVGGVAWLGGGLAGLRALAEYHPIGLTWDPRPIVLMLLLPIWAGDTLAYLGGRKWGRTPLAPEISPNKTREGALAGLAGALVVAVLTGRWLGVPLGASLLVGVAVGYVGPAGDLLESLLKRRVGLKDSGTLLPGHGGVLDRIDSLLLAAPVVALLLLR